MEGAESTYINSVVGFTEEATSDGTDPVLGISM